MLIDKLTCHCPKCHSEQTYYHVISINSDSVLPLHMNNSCLECGYSLRKEDVPNWEEVENGYRGTQGEEGRIKLDKRD